MRDYEWRELPGGLFREFAELQTIEEFALFASAHGDLFSHGALVPFPDGSIRMGTLEAQWVAATTELRTLVSIWDAVRKPDYAVLRRYLRHTLEGPSFNFETPTIDARGVLKRSHKLAVVQGRTLLSKEAFRFKKHDLVLPARCALQDEINERLDAHPTSVVLRWSEKLEAEGRARDYQSRMFLRPSSLVAAMWLQFAQAVAGDYQLKKCFCGKFFHVGPGGRRKHATVCSDLCRVKRHQAAKRRVKQSSQPVQSPKSDADGSVPMFG